MKADARDPFVLTANPADYVPREATERALFELEAALGGGGRRPVLLSGPAGLGKTLLLRVLEERLQGRHAVVYVPHAALAPEEFAAWLLGLAGETAASDPWQALRALGARATARGHSLLFLVDDAAALPAETARAVADLALAPDTGVAFLLAAADDERLDALRAALGRALVEVRLDAPMTEAETASYLRIRLARAGIPARDAARFDAAAVDRLHLASEGVPQRLQGLADALLRLDVEPELAPAPEPAQTPALELAPAPPPEEDLAPEVAQRPEAELAPAPEPACPSEARVPPAPELPLPRVEAEAAPAPSNRAAIAPLLAQPAVAEPKSPSEPSPPEPAVALEPSIEPAPPPPPNAHEGLAEVEPTPPYVELGPGAPEPTTPPVVEPLLAAASPAAPIVEPDREPTPADGPPRAATREATSEPDPRRRPEVAAPAAGARHDGLETDDEILRRLFSRRAAVAPLRPTPPASPAEPRVQEAAPIAAPPTPRSSEAPSPRVAAPPPALQEETPTPREEARAPREEAVTLLLRAPEAEVDRRPQADQPPAIEPEDEPPWSEPEDEPPWEADEPGEAEELEALDTWEEPAGWTARSPRRPLRTLGRPPSAGEIGLTAFAIAAAAIAAVALREWLAPLAPGAPRPRVEVAEIAPTARAVPRETTREGVGTSASAPRVDSAPEAAAPAAKPATSAPPAAANPEAPASAPAPPAADGLDWPEPSRHPFEGGRPVPLAPVRAPEPPPVAPEPIPAAPPAPVTAAAAPRKPPPAAPTQPPPAPVDVHINATPWATISVDGTELGETPLAGVPLTPGPHRFVARMPDGRRIERTIEVGASQRHVVFE